MQLSTIFATILKIFATTPDLCAEVHVDATGQPITDSVGQTLSRYCQWTGPDAPLLNADVCCDIDDGVAACVLPDSNGRCSIGSRYYCEHGQAGTAGAVCYQPLPDACVAGFCVKMPELPPPTQAFMLCCSAGGVCMEIENSAGAVACGEGGGEFVACDHGVQNADGTVECFD